MFVIGWLMIAFMVLQFTVAGVVSQVACEAVYDLENNDTSAPGSILSPRMVNLFQQKTERQSSEGYTIPSYSSVVQ
jgi:hypothetical protein